VGYQVKKWMLLLLLVVCVGGGLYFWRGLVGVQPLQEKVLSFAEVRQVTIRDTISATGRVEPRKIVFVSSEGAGTVVRLSKRIGDTVLDGEELARLDDRRIVLKIEEANTGIKMAEAAILQAEAALVQADAIKEAAQRNLKMQEDVAGVGGIRAEREQAKAQLDAAVAGIKVAKAGIDVARSKKDVALTALKEARLAHDMTRIQVPGVRSWRWLAHEFLVLDRKVNEGQMVGPQSGPLFMLAGSFDVVEVRAEVVEGDINKIREGLTALFKVPNYDQDETEFEGVITKIRPLSSAVKGAVYYDAVIEVKNRRDPKTNDWQLRPGMTAALDIVRRERKNAWRVPSGALDFTMDEAYQSESAKAHVAQWRKRPDEKDWRPLWVWNSATHQAEPIFIRVGGKLDGDFGLKDSEGNEILEWEAGKEPTGPLRVIIKAPPARPPGFLDQPANVKI
jgi:multidrug efflux pump subunit AcrA (membrane-fusion protein)